MTVYKHGLHNDVMTFMLKISERTMHIGFLKRSFYGINTSTLKSQT